MKIEYHRYQLKFKDNFGIIGQGSTREGALLRVTFEDGLMGYCDCHPWSELGDLPLSTQLELLTHPDKTPLLNCSLKFARIDAKARRDQRSVFEGFTIPPSHQLVSLNDSLQRFVAEGITHFKLKVGTDSQNEISVLSSWVDRFPNIKFRLDFNERFNRKLFLGYWDSIPLATRQSIDFVEDPYPFNPKEWSEDQSTLQTNFAADRSAKNALQYPESAQVIIHKPAVEEPPKWIHENTKLVITTYLDHPFGQMCAAYAAAKLKVHFPKQVDFCGLLSHKCYQENPFIEAVNSNGPHLLPSVGTGFGFNSLLEGLVWQNR